MLMFDTQLSCFIQVIYIHFIQQHERMSEELEHQVEELRAKLEKTESDFETYKASAKELEQFLEQESSKKEEEIRSLKQELIVKEKNFKQVKQELTMLQNDNSELKNQLAKIDEQADKDKESKQTLKKLQEKITTLEAAKNQLSDKIVEKSSVIVQLTEQLKQKDSLESRAKELSGELDVTSKKIAELEEENSKLLKQMNDNTKSTEQVAIKSKELRDSKADKSSQDIDELKNQLKKERQHYEEKIKKLEDGAMKQQKHVKDLKHKIQVLTDQNVQLQSRTFNVTINNTGSPSPVLIKGELEDEDFSLRPSYSCLVLTKPHYISPFLQLYPDKQLIKIYKSSRTGCFQKSMGSYRHKFDNTSYDQQAILEPLVNRIRDMGGQGQHTVIFYGVKKSSKKYMMSKLIVYLKDFLIDLMDQTEEVEALYLKRSQEEDKNFAMSGDSKQSILEVLDKVIALGYKSDKSKEKSLAGSRKVQSKPKVRYFRISIGDFSLQIGTSSHTSFSFRQKTTTSAMLNKIIYSKLPNVLQSSMTQKHLVLTLNPIVDLYEDCKNTLSTTFCKHMQEEYHDEMDISESWKSSPVREELNDMTKKKLETFQKQNEETSLKIRKLEEQCNYYRVRFDELEFRLKNLLNTHAAQNTYLKKSPVTLSYEKLLKFVHSVQQRNSLSANLTHASSMMLKSNIYSERDNESVDAM